METLIFLLFIGICIGIFALAARKSKYKKDLARRRSHDGFRKPAEKSLHSLDSRLANKDEIWKARQKLASEGLAATKLFVPKSELEAESQYDGYSRRDRHHLTKTANVKEEGHVENLEAEELAPTSFVAWKGDEDAASIVGGGKNQTSAG